MSGAGANGTRRILWLGNHGLLLRTELPRLRALGFEVFHAPCRALVRAHQSASTAWVQGPTTLPPEVHARLADSDLYFAPIDRPTFQLLNDHFAVAVVTIQARWAAELLRGFTGKIIYRAYGDSTTVSEQLWGLGAFPAVVRRDDFWFAPHAVEYGCQEQAWLRRREAVVPYCVDELVASSKDSWVGGSPEREVMLSCPNIGGNPYYANHFAELKQAFNHPSYKIYGLQPQTVADPQVVGTLPFSDIVQRYRSAAAALYTYRWPTVCLLPPIEMMIVGGPVVYLRGSLLDRYIGPGAPGCARDMLEAWQTCERLRAGDRALASAIVAAQAAIRERYLPEYVWPRFDAAMRSIVDGAAPPIEPVDVRWSGSAVEERGRVVVLAYHPSLAPALDAGRYISAEPTVVHLVQLLRALLARRAGLRVVIACRGEDVAAWHGLLAQELGGARFTFLCHGGAQPDLPPSPSAPPAAPDRRGIADRVKDAAARAIPPGRLRGRLRRLQTAVAPPVEARLLRHNPVISLHPHCEPALAPASITRLYAARDDEAAVASIASRLEG